MEGSGRSTKGQWKVAEWALEGRRMGGGRGQSDSVGAGVVPQLLDLAAPQHGAEQRVLRPGQLGSLGAAEGRWEVREGQ